MNKTAKNLDNRLCRHIHLLIERYPTLEPIKEEIIQSYLLMEECYKNGGKLLVCGNGGSAADSEHIVGELMKGFKLTRPTEPNFSDRLKSIDPVKGELLSQKLQGALPAIALVSHQALNTAYLNDVDGQLTFAQQLNGYGKQGDVLIGISTSGNSKNVVYAAVAAKAKAIKVIGLTGANGGELAGLADVTVKAPNTEVYMIQEMHLPIYHCWCLMLEDRFFGENEKL